MRIVFTFIFVKRLNVVAQARQNDARPPKVAPAFNFTIVLNIQSIVFRQIKYKSGFLLRLPT